MSVTVNGGINFNHVIFKGYVEPVFDPLDLFALGQLGAWYDPTDLSVMFQTNTEATPVTAQGQTVGRINDKTPNAFYASQATAANRPLLDNYSNVTGQSAANINRLKYDLNNDTLLWSGPTGTYWVAYANITGVQIYQCLLSNNKQLPVIEFSQMIIRDTAFTGPETIELTNYLEQYRTGLSSPTYLLELSTSNFVSYQPVSTGSATAYWQYGVDAPVYVPNSGLVGGIIPRSAYQFTCDPVTQLSGFSCEVCWLAGSIPDFTGQTALTVFNCSNNKLQGGIRLPDNVNLSEFNCQSNLLTGSIPDLSTYTALTVFRCGSNNLTGSIPDLSANTALTVFDCGRNYNADGRAITGTIPSLSANTALIEFVCSDNRITGPMPDFSNNINLEIILINTNLLSGSMTSLSANIALREFSANGNNFTGPIPSLSNNTNLEIFELSGNVSGNIPALSNNSNLITFSLNSTPLITGNVPDLTNNVNLEQFICLYGQLTGWTGGTVSDTITLMNLTGNNLTQSAVNALLAAFVAAGGTGGLIGLADGTNAAPSGQGITDKATLQSRGWTVTTN